MNHLPARWRAQHARAAAAIAARPVADILRRLPRRMDGLLDEWFDFCGPDSAKSGSKKPGGGACPIPMYCYNAG